jgi:hypothetical protein
MKFGLTALGGPVDPTASPNEPIKKFETVYVTTYCSDSMTLWGEDSPKPTLSAPHTAAESPSNELLLNHSGKGSVYVPASCHALDFLVSKPKD